MQQVTEKLMDFSPSLEVTSKPGLAPGGHK